MTIKSIQEVVIYESPDGGKTVYSRTPGSSIRELHSESDEVKSLHEQLLEDKMWGDIRRLAKTNTTLKDAVDKVITVYHLIKDRK
jgi:hypothetical protein